MLLPVNKSSALNQFSVYDLTDCDNACALSIQSTEERYIDVRDATVQTRQHTKYDAFTFMYSTSNDNKIDSSTQSTQPYISYSNTVNDIDTNSIVIQTNESAIQNTTSSVAIPTDPLSQQCIQFLQSILPTIESELQYKYDALDTYNLDALNSDDTATLTRLCTLPSRITITSPSNDPDQRCNATTVACMTYNKLCTSLCVGYGHNNKQHSGWCTHRSSIHIWNMLRHDIYDTTATATNTTVHTPSNLLQPDIRITADLGHCLVK